MTVSSIKASFLKDSRKAMAGLPSLIKLASTKESGLKAFIMELESSTITKEQ